jgi:rubredoxin
VSQDVYYLQQGRCDCDAFGHTETLEWPKDRYCPHCGDLMGIWEMKMDDRARARFYARAEGLGFIQNQNETRFLGPE